MSEMVERVAKALFLAAHPGSDWSAGRARSKWWALAEAAIAEMREPTEAMQWAAVMSTETIHETRKSRVTHTHAPAMLTKAFEAMIDEALR